MTNEEKAQKLAAWLQSPPGSPPPEGLDPEVLATVVTLRPERAPAPRVSIDEVIGSVGEGPFKKGEVVAFAPKPKSSAAKWLFGAGTSALLAAAALTLVVLPVARTSMEDEVSLAPAAEPATAAAPAAPAPPPAEPVAEAASGSVEQAVASRTAEPQRGAAGADGPVGTPLADKDVAESTSGDRWGAAGAPADEAPKPSAPPMKEAEKAAVSQPTIAEADARDLERAQLEVLGYSEPVGAGGAAREEAAPSAPAAAAPVTTTSTGATTTVTSDELSAAVSKKAKTEERKSAPKADAADDSIADTSSRSAAVPTDYVATWYTAYPDVTAAYNSGNYSSLLNDSRKDVAMDAAWRAATAAYRSGNTASARSMVDAGLRKSTANTVFRSQLLVLSGDLYAAAGDSARASTAWSEAARLNRTR